MRIRKHINIIHSVNYQISKMNREKEMNIDY
jgi:hypothetical protein